MPELAPYTIPEFTKDDFHNQVAANIYQYPFSVEGARFPVVSDEETVKYPPLVASFEKVELPGTKYEYFVQPGLDLHESITRCSADGVIEVAGPTTDGYLALENTDLLRRPIITNIAGSRTIDSYSAAVKADTLVPIDSIVLDALADVRHLPVSASSVGILLASCVMRTQDFPNIVDHEGNELVSFDEK